MATELRVSQRASVSAMRISSLRPSSGVMEK